MSLQLPPTVPSAPTSASGAAPTAARPAAPPAAPPTARTAAPLAAMAAGVVQIAVGVVQAVDPGDTIPTLRPVEHVVLGLYAVSLVLLVPAYLGLAATTGRRRGAAAACVGMLLLSAGMTATNLHDQDYGWFPAVAVPANALWLLGTIALAVALWRTPGMPRWVALGVVLTWVGGIPLSQLGGAVVPGAYWLAVGALIGAGTLLRGPQPVRG